MADLKPGFKKKIKLLIPGKLDYFSFRLRHMKETEKHITLKADIDSIWLRLFAPSMTMIYEKATGHMVKYEGISNLLDDEGEVQNVIIDYVY